MIRVVESLPTRLERNQQWSCSTYEYPEFFSALRISFVARGTKPGAYHGDVGPNHDIDNPPFGVKAQHEEDGGERNEDTHHRYDTTVVPIGIDIIRGGARRSCEDAWSVTLVTSPLIDIAMDCNMQTQWFETSIRYVLLQTNPTSDSRTIRRHEVQRWTNLQNGGHPSI